MFLLIFVVSALIGAYVLAYHLVVGTIILAVVMIVGAIAAWPRYRARNYRKGSGSS